MVEYVNTVSGQLDGVESHKADLDQALAVAGIGWYNVKYSTVSSLFLIAAVLEAFGNSYLLPAAVCDLEMSDSQRGFVASLPYIGVVATSFFWGYLVDTQGRRRMMLYTSLVGGSFGILAAFMPNLILFAACKFVTAFCMASPAVVPYTYIGEILPLEHRDFMLSIMNSMQVSGVALVPLLSWAILPLDFRIDFGAYEFRSWRLLAIVFSSTFVLSAFLLYFGPESPKFLVSKGLNDDAIKVLQKIYAGNTGKSPNDYPIKILTSEYSRKENISVLNSLKRQSLPLLKLMYLKWLALTGFMLFGVYATANGLYVWVPDVLNRILTTDAAGVTTCQVIRQRLNQTIAEDMKCIDTIDNITFLVNSVASVSCGVVGIIVSSTAKFIDKKTLLFAVLFPIGTFCILVNFLTQEIIISILLSTLSLLGLAIGPINAYAVEIFPIHLRGMATSLIMMISRSGSIISTNVVGLMLNSACEATFYFFGGLLYLCGALILFLPKSSTTVVKTSKRRRSYSLNA